MDDGESVIFLQHSYRGENGHVYQDGDRLIAWLDVPSKITGSSYALTHALKTIRKFLESRNHHLEILQHGEAEASISDADGAEDGWQTFLEAVKARRRRRLSEPARQKALAALGKASQFHPNPALRGQRGAKNCLPRVESSKELMMAVKDRF